MSSQSKAAVPLLALFSRSLLPVAFLACGAILASQASAVGLVSRPANPDCTAPDRPSSGLSVPVSLEPFFGDSNGGPFDSYPVVVAQSPVDPKIWYVAEVEGRVLRIDTTLPVFVTTTVLDYRSSVYVVCTGCEGGLIGMALHPNFAVNGEVFLHYTAMGTPYVSRVSRFTSSDGGLTLNPASEEILISIAQTKANHQGGDMAFATPGASASTL